VEKGGSSCYDPIGSYKMASQEVTGSTLEELEERAKQYYERSRHAASGVSFEEAFCLLEIPQQPDSYEGPTRYCSQFCFKLGEHEFAPKCRFHGGANTSETANPDLDSLVHNNKASYIKHGMYASDEHLKEFLDGKEQKLYNRILSWAEVYGFSEEEDPGPYQMLRTLAIEEVRKAKSAEYLLEEGETDQKPIFDGQGNLRDQEDVTNALSEEHQKQVKLTIKLMKELGITPKEQARMGKDEADASASEALAEVAKQALDPDGGEYNPEEFEDGS
jgi:hypothetical protein